MKRFFLASHRITDRFRSRLWSSSGPTCRITSPHHVPASRPVSRITSPYHVAYHASRPRTTFPYHVPKSVSRPRITSPGPASRPRITSPDHVPGSRPSLHHASHPRITSRIPHHVPAPHSRIDSGYRVIYTYIYDHVLTMSYLSIYQSIY
jgi:hypothetical protein